MDVVFPPFHHGAGLSRINPSPPIHTLKKLIPEPLLRPGDVKGPPSYYSRYPGKERLEVANLGARRRAGGCRGLSRAVPRGTRERAGGRPAGGFWCPKEGDFPAVTQVLVRIRLKVNV